MAVAVDQFLREHFRCHSGFQDVVKLKHHGTTSRDGVITLDRDTDRESVLF